MQFVPISFSACPLRRAWLAAGLVLLAVTWSPRAVAVDAGKLAKFWTADSQRVPYRALVTPGREHGELLPLIVFLHGDWQDGTNNE